MIKAISTYRIFPHTTNLLKSSKKYLQYYPDGKIKEEVTYKYGVPNGLWTIYYKNGKVIFENEWIKVDRGTVK